MSKLQKIPYRKLHSHFLTLLLCLSAGLLCAQNNTPVLGEILAHMSDKNWSTLSPGNVEIEQNENLMPFFEKLRDLYQNDSSQLNIVHIGDSHIQAGFMTSEIRDGLQAVFGNAGLGFTFPHRLAKSNGSSAIRYTSSVPWTAKRNLYATDLDPVGLSGFSLTTNTSDFALNLEIKEERFYFSGLKLFTPSPTPVFELAEMDEPLQLQNWETTYKTHRIQSGEALSIIARKYGVSVAQIKTVNHLKSNLIRAGATLRIPVKTQKAPPIDRTKFKILQGAERPGYFKYDSTKPLKSIWLLPHEKTDHYALNGIFLENSSPGIIYSGIGVNGARFKDYNKTPLFFQQLPYLEPDLLVVSLGTNEAHGQIKTDQYMDDLVQFINQVRVVLPHTPLLITTPPPMLDRRTTPNKLVKEYTQAIRDYGADHKVAVWNLYEALGGNQNIRENYSKGWYFKDYIHYTEKGYMHSGNLFTEALLNAFYQTTQKHLIDEF